VNSWYFRISLIAFHWRWPLYLLTATDPYHFSSISYQIFQYVQVNCRISWIFFHLQGRSLYSFKFWLKFLQLIWTALGEGDTTILLEFLRLLSCRLCGTLKTGRYWSWRRRNRTRAPQNLLKNLLHSECMGFQLKLLFIEIQSFNQRYKPWILLGFKLNLFIGKANEFWMMGLILNGILNDL